MLTGILAFGLMALATLGLMRRRPEPKRVPVRVRTRHDR